MPIELKQAVGFAVSRRLEMHWNKKLTQSSGNPFPLAPPDLVRLGLVNPEEYQFQNLALQQFCNGQMTKEFISISPGTLEMWGPGLGRDLDFLVNVAKNFTEVTIRDSSSVACTNTDNFLEERQLQNQVQVIHCDVLKELKYINWTEISTVYLCQGFLQVQKPKAMAKIMQRLGKFLSLPSPTGAPKRKVYILTAREQDNNQPVLWNSRAFTSVEWGDTTPYNNSELLEPAKKGFGKKGNVSLTELARHKYYHQTYVLMCLTADV